MNIGFRIVDRVVLEALEWKEAIEKYQQEQKEAAKVQEPKRIGFKFDPVVVNEQKR